MTKNLKAFLDMIAFSEGTDKPGQKTNNRGYDVIVGGELFTGNEHPNKLVSFPKLGIKSTAAGRYQILYKFWVHYEKQLKLVGGFTPENQDKVAIQLIRECKALDDIEAGRIEIAIQKCNSRWASLPGAGYNQHEHKVKDLLAAYIRAGGHIV